MGVRITQSSQTLSTVVGKSFPRGLVHLAGGHALFWQGVRNVNGNSLNDRLRIPFGGLLIEARVKWACLNHSRVLRQVE